VAKAKAEAMVRLLNILAHASFNPGKNFFLGHRLRCEKTHTHTHTHTLTHSLTRTKLTGADGEGKEGRAPFSRPRGIGQSVFCPSNGSLRLSLLPCRG